VNPTSAVDNFENLFRSQSHETRQLLLSSIDDMRITYSDVYDITSCPHLVYEKKGRKFAHLSLMLSFEKKFVKYVTVTTLATDLRHADLFESHFRQPLLHFPAEV
jgi:hypothetical protein